MAWRLGVDLGTNSLGWWAFEVAREGDRWQVRKSLDGAVYIFPDGREPAKSGRVGDSNAVARRAARGMRRNRDRGRTRLRALMRELIALGLMPDSPEERRILFQARKGGADPDRYNPYRLRSEAIERELKPFELGRALFHLGLRRGFKSNRAEQTDEDGGKLKERIDGLRKVLGDQTLGQFLWDRFREEREKESNKEKASGIRFRGDQKFYPDRKMCEKEFDSIQERQATPHSLSAEDWKRLRNRYVLFQWPLKSVKRGSCEFFWDEPRHWKDTPIGHDFRIYQELNALRCLDANYAEHLLDREQRNAVLNLLLTRKGEVKFGSLRSRRIKRADGSPLFPEDSTFNLESEKRKGLKPHASGVALASDPVLAPMWERRRSEAGDGGLLDDIFEALNTETDSEVLKKRLTNEWGLDDKQSESLESLQFGRATASVSRRFMEQIVPVMRDQGLMYHEAFGELTDEMGEPLHHSHGSESENRDTLPYYGEILRGSMLGADPAADPVHRPEKHFGKINNPTVHVALNCLRRVCNALIERFGEPPVEIHVELARDLKNSRMKRDEETKLQARNQRENDRIREDLAKHGIAYPSARDVKKVKLWEELSEKGMAGRCPFSGHTVSFAQLLNGEAEIEHILPFKRTLDDSMANLTVAMRWANRIKGNLTPFEAFASGAHEKDGISWETVRVGADSLPSHKRWRFGPDAMKRYESENGFIARQLSDNAYIAVSAVKYLGCLKGVEQIVPNPGRLTAMLRGKWRLNGILSDDNRKTREDHRHHAIDAAVIGLADRSVLNEVSRLTARGAEDRVHIAVPDLPSDIEQAIRKRTPEIVVAFKPNHGWQGGMFKETAYGFVDPGRRDPDFPEHNLVVRKALTELTRAEFKTIRDPSIREEVRDCLAAAKKADEKPEKALVQLTKEKGIARVRILVKDGTVTPIRSAPYKGYKSDSYVCCDIWRCPKGKQGKWKAGEFKWQGEFWPYTETPNGVPAASSRKPHPAAKFVARLYKNDLVAYEESGKTQIMRVAGFKTTDNRLEVVPHNLTISSQSRVSINVLGGRGLRKLHVTPDGRVKGLSQGE